jgi:5-methylcytosine-specific restriction protein A
MSAVILGWDPARGNRWNYSAVVERVRVSGLHLEPWGMTRGVAAGTDAWLLLLGVHGPGLLGHGVVLSGQQEPAAYPDPTEITVQVAFDVLLPLGDHVSADILNKAVPGVAWDSTDVDGLEVGPGDASAIRSLWAEFGPAPGPHPTQVTPGTYPASAVARVPVNRYESDPEARRACIAHRGSSCAVCGFSFEVAYGEMGKDFIDVHHLVPPGLLGGGYQLDPLTDLVPLCLNCHAMAHYGVGNARTEVELRRAMATAGYLAGAVVTPADLEAQRAAREILGPG